MEEKDRIEKIMQLENMNSAQFAMETGIQTSTLSHILNGRNKVSLDVLKKILNRFRTISSDWLILGIGAMYRQERQSQAPTLFDFESENSIKSASYMSEYPQNNESENNTNQQKPFYLSDTNQQTAQSAPIFLPPIEKVTRDVKKIIVYYSDNSFQEFASN